MGVESYFLSLKTNKAITINELKIKLISKGFEVKQYYEFYNQNIGNSKKAYCL